MIKRVVVGCCVLCGMLYATSLTAQEKYEREYRIAAKAVPATAATYVESLALPGRVRWYLEEGLDSISYEAETKYRGRRHSIEFADNGRLADVEVQIDFADLPDVLRRRIEEALSERHDEHRMRKVQLQYTGSPTALATVFTEKAGTDQLQVAYECVVDTKDGQDYRSWEYLFTHEGVVRERLRIVQRKTTNLEY